MIDQEKLVKACKTFAENQKGWKVLEDCSPWIICEDEFDDIHFIYCSDTDDEPSRKEAERFSVRWLTKLTQESNRPVHYDCFYIQTTGERLGLLRAHLDFLQEADDISDNSLILDKLKDIEHMLEKIYSAVR